MKKVLFVSYGGAHVKSLLPLLTNKINSVYIPLTTAIPKVCSAGIPYKPLSFYVETYRESAMELGKTLLKNYHNPNTGIPEVESCAYLGVNLLENIERYGEDTAHKILEEKGLKSFYPLNFCKYILETERPDVVICTDSPRMEVAMLHACHELKIPSICLLTLFPFLEVKNLSQSKTGTYIAVENEAIRDALIKNGRPPKEIIVTGNPAFDAFRTKTYRKFLSNQQDRVIVWAETPEPKKPQFLIDIRESLIYFKKRHPEIKVVFRFHPSTIQRNLSYSTPEDITVSPKEEDLLSVLRTASIVISTASTTTYEALLMGIPNMVVKGSQYDSYVQYTEDDGIIVVPNVKSLYKALVRFFFAEKPHGAELCRTETKRPSRNGTQSIQCLINKLLSEEA